jgi:hypothetical protein
MRGRGPDYPGMTDPRADMEKLRWAYDYCMTLQRRFHASSPVYDAFQPVRAALREAAYAVTLDPHFFGIGRGGQTVMPPPPAPPIPGIVLVTLTNPKRKHPT